MHNKLFITDSQTAILSGGNIGDEYFAANPTLEFDDLISWPPNLSLDETLPRL